MDIYPRQKLCEIITLHGHTICSTPKKLKGLLRNSCPHFHREVNILLTALKQKIPLDLLNSAEIPYEPIANQLVKRLCESIPIGVAEEFARWAVDTWALALGVIQKIPVPTLPDKVPPEKPPEKSPAKRGRKKKVATPQLTYSILTNPVGQLFTFETVKLNHSGKVICNERRQARQITENLGDGVTLDVVHIPGGSFLMGTLLNEGNENEKPQHLVTIQPFYMGKYPVTQAQYQLIMGTNPSRFKGDHRPVEMVSWEDAVAFCQKLSQQTSHTYQLPSEAQWEYACRAGTISPFAFGETLTTDLANYDGNYTYANGPKGQYRVETTPVGSFLPNAFGLHDMHGNVWEWCLDVWHENYVGAPTDGSAWVDGEETSYHISRGGSWSFNTRNCRSGNRHKFNNRHGNHGFRVMLKFNST